MAVLLPLELAAEDALAAHASAMYGHVIIHTYMRLQSRVPLPLSGKLGHAAFRFMPFAVRRVATYARRRCGLRTTSGISPLGVSAFPRVHVCTGWCN